MKPSAIKMALHTIREANLPCFLWGPPGVGKSQVVDQFTKEADLQMRDVRAILLDPVDLRGLPHINGDNRAHWAVPDFLPRDGKGVLFLDELNVAAPMVQAACFTADTMIGGAGKPIGELQAGDTVLDHLGVKRSVEQVFSRPYAGSAYKIKARHFEEITATEEHPFLVVKKYQKGNESWSKKGRCSEPEWITARDLAVGHYVSTPILQPTTNAKSVEISASGDVSTSIALTSDFARFLGYYVGDGYAGNGRIGICLNVSEKEYHEDLSGIIRRVFNREPVVRSYSSTGNAHDVGFGWNALEAWLKSTCGENVYSKRIPDFILYHEDREILRQFLIGYFRADGHIYNGDEAKSFIGFTTVCRALAQQVQQAFTRFGVLAAICTRAACEIIIHGKISQQREYYRIQSSQQESFNLLGLQKRSGLKRPTRHYFEAHGALWARIDKIEKFHLNGMVYNCEVEETHTYTANNVAVHNCYQLVLDRQLGEYILPEGWTVIAAGNRASDRAVTHAMPAPLRNRFVHLDFEVDLDDWCNWALGAGSPKWHRPKAEKSTTGMRPEIVAFLRFRPALLHEFSDKTRDANAFPTPRTWEYLSRILATNPPLEIEHALTAGTVGPGASAEFIGFLRVYRDLPDMDLILKKPDKAPVPKEPAALYAVATAVAHRATQDNFQNVVTYLCRLPEEFSVMAMRDAQTRVPKLASTTPFADWVTKHQHVLM